MADSELHNTVEVKVQASFTSSSGYSDWVSARPELLLIKVRARLPTQFSFATNYELQYTDVTNNAGMWSIDFKVSRVAS